MGAVEAVVLDVNEGKRRAENLEKLSEIAGRIKFDDLKTPGTDDVRSNKQENIVRLLTRSFSFFSLWSLSTLPASSCMKEQ